MGNWGVGRLWIHLEDNLEPQVNSCSIEVETTRDGSRIANSRFRAGLNASTAFQRRYPKTIFFSKSQPLPDARVHSFQRHIREGIRLAARVAKVKAAEAAAVARVEAAERTADRNAAAVVCIASDRVKAARALCRSLGIPLARFKIVTPAGAAADRKRRIADAEMLLIEMPSRRLSRKISARLTASSRRASCSTMPSATDFLPTTSETTSIEPSQTRSE
jgi:hypothetical protein